MIDSALLSASGEAVDGSIVNAEEQQIQPGLEVHLTGSASVCSCAGVSRFGAQTVVAAHRECAGAIPYRVRDGVLEVLLITSRGNGRWIIPKGRMEEGLTAAKCASLEAFEEAGVVGIIDPESVGSYVHRNSRETQRVRVHLLRVETTLPHWPERLERQRLWSPFECAAARVEEAELRQMIFDLKSHL